MPTTKWYELLVERLSLFGGNDVEKLNDWRLMGQEKFLEGKTLVQKPYVIRKPRWEHDHCEFCMERIDETVKNAYCTEDEYHWVCQKCFNDFKEVFKWKTISG